MGESVQTSPAMGAGTAGVNPLMGLLAQSDPIPQDPFENLSRSQRTMIGFAALKDAGMALQGKEGNAVNNVMQDITNRADMERKRQAAVANQQMMANVLSGAGGAGMGQPKTSEEARQMAGRLAQQIAMMGDAGQNLVPMLQQLQAEATRLEAMEKGTTSTTQSTAESLETVEDMLNTVRSEDGVTGFWGMVLGKIPWSKAAEVRIDADTLRSNMALGALMKLKSSGATLGSVSEAELKLLESEIAQLNLNQSKDAVLKDLTKIQNRYKRAIQSAYANTAEPEKLDKIMESVFGGRPEWASGSYEEYTFDTVPQGQIAFDNGVPYVYRGGARDDASSWEEIK